MGSFPGGAMYVVGLRDGSSIVLDGLFKPSQRSESEPEAGTLAASQDAMAWIGDAVAAGVTFDVLKAIAAELLRRSWTRPTRTIDAAGITAVVRDYLTSVGYESIGVTEIQQIANSGWALEGTADESSFRALADPQGEVTHIRVS